MITDNLPAELKAEADKINAHMKATLDARDAEWKTKLDAMSKSFDEKLEADRAKWEAKVASFSVPGSESATHKGKKFDIGAFYRAVWTKDWREAEHEKAISDEATRKVRAMGVVPDSTGGFAVPTEVMTDQIIPLLYAKSILATLGATQLTGLTSIPISIPKVTGGSTAYWLDEHGAMTTSQMSFGQVRMTPRILATVTVWSELLNTSQPAINNMILQDQARAMALK